MGKAICLPGMHQPIHLAIVAHPIVTGYQPWTHMGFRHLGALPSPQTEGHSTARDLNEWETGSILDWANEAHQIARAVSHGNLGDGSPALITPAYEQHADHVLELQLERAGVRLAWLLTGALK